MTDDTKPPKRLSFGRLIAFALPAGPSQAFETPLSVYAPAFYAAQMGLGLGLVGTLFSIARIAEIPIGIVAGAVSDRWGGTRHRRRFWLLIATPLMMLSAWRLFAPPAVVSGGYLLGWLIALMSGAALFWVNHAAWGAEMTDDYHGRTATQAARQVVSVAATILVLVAPVLIERWRAADVELARMQSIAWFVLILLPLTVVAALVWAPERAPRARTERVHLRQAFDAIRRNRPLRLLLAADICDSLALGVVTSLYVFLAGDAWGLGRLSSLMLLGYLISGLVCLGPILRLARTRLKHRLAAVIAVALALALPLLLLVPAHAAGWAIACTVLLGAPSAINSALFESIMGDVAEYDAARNGGSRAALFYALHMITGRVGRGVAVAAGFAVLGWIGFHPHAANAPAVLLGFKLVYIVPPMLLQLAIAGLMWRFPLGGNGLISEAD